MRNMKPILCNTQVVQNILAGRQTQDRRPMRVQPGEREGTEVGDVYFDPISGKVFKAVESTGRNKRAAGILTPKEIKPKYQVGEVLYVRERTKLIDLSLQYDGWYGQFKYEADDTTTNWVRWPDRIKMMKLYHCCSNGCFKELARIFLKVKAVRVERIRDISEADCFAEGIKDPLENGGMNVDCEEVTAFVIEQFKTLWESIFPGSWERNDWVFVDEFERCEK